MGMTVLAAIAALFVANVSAQVVYKCVGSDGSVVYQSERCSAGQRATDAWSATPASPRDLAEAEQRRRQRQRDARYLDRLADRYRSPVGTQIPAQPARQRSACEIAREQRDRYMRNHHGNYEIRDQLDNAVMRACY